MLARAVDVPLAHLVGIDFAGDQLPEMREIRIQVVRMSERLKIGDEQFGFAVADNVAHRAIHLDPAAIQRHQRHADRSVFA